MHERSDPDVCNKLRGWDLSVKARPNVQLKTVIAFTYILGRYHLHVHSLLLPKT